MTVPATKVEAGLRTRDFLHALKARYPDQVLTISEVVDPARFEVTGVLAALESRGESPVVCFERPLNLKGQLSRMPIVSNIFASRQRCALALGVEPSEFRLPLSLEYARRERQKLPPAVVRKEEAPVKQWVRTGETVDLRELPIIRFHEMDPAPYIDMVCLMRHPETGGYNAAFLRNMFKGPRRLGVHMSPRHNWQIVRVRENQSEPTPVAIVVSHHPAFYLGALNVRPYGEDDYEVIGAFLGHPLRLVASETLGDEFLVPADADLVIEGRVVPGAREVEGPFGEFTGYYGPQRLRWVIEVSAITGSLDGYYQGIFVGHKDNWTLGALPKEGAIYNRIRGVVPGVKAVHLPESGCGRFHCYISLDKRVDGESKQAAMIALGEIDFVKHVVVVDADVDVFDETQVWWAVATRVQADQDVDVIRNAKGNTLDPSQTDDIMTAKMIIDATRPVQRPFAERVQVPAEALRRGHEILDGKSSPSREGARETLPERGR